MAELDLSPSLREALEAQLEMATVAREALSAQLSSLVEESAASTVSARLRYGTGITRNCQFGQEN